MAIRKSKNLTPKKARSQAFICDRIIESMTTPGGWLANVSTAAWDSFVKTSKKVRKS